MTEELCVNVLPSDENDPEFRAWRKSLESAGLRSEDGAVGHDIFDSINVFVPLADPQILKVFELAERQGIIEQWTPSRIFQRYTETDIAEAACFSLFAYGAFIYEKGDRSNLVTAPAVDFDFSHACKKCGAGARQTSPVRIDGTYLNQLGRFASVFVGKQAILVSDRLLTMLQSACKENLPVRPVEIIEDTKAREGWWQLDPVHQIPIEACSEGRRTRQVCQLCKAVRLGQPADEPESNGYYMVRKSALNSQSLPAVFLCPYWSDEAKWADTDRVSRVASRDIWLRGDIARSLRSLKLPSLYLMPALTV